VNLTPMTRYDYRVGMPAAGRWVEILGSDDLRYGGSGVHVGAVTTEPVPWHGREHSVAVTLPPLAVTLLAREQDGSSD